MGCCFCLVYIMYGCEIFEVVIFCVGYENYINDKIFKVSDEGMLLWDNVYGMLFEDVGCWDFFVNVFYYDFCYNLIYDFFNGIEELCVGKLCLLGELI